MDWFKLFLKRWSDTAGRSERREYIAGLLGMVAAVAAMMLPVVGFAAILAFIVMIVPFWTVTIRRWHDLNLPGFMVLFGVVIPGFNVICALFLATIPGKSGRNNYGDDAGLPRDYLGKI